MSSIEMIANFEKMHARAMELKRKAGEK